MPRKARPLAREVDRVHRIPILAAVCTSEKSGRNACIAHPMVVHVGEVTSLPEATEQNLKEYLFFETTEAGIQWWFGERVKLHDEKYYGKLDVNRLAEPSANNPPMVEGKGIGGRLRASHQSQIGPMFKGLQDGLFKFVHYWSCPWYGEQTLTVELTEKGMRYFDSLPKLMLECA